MTAKKPLPAWTASKGPRVYAAASRLVPIDPDAFALFFAVDYDLMEEDPERAKEIVRQRVQEAFGEHVKVRTHEINLGYAADLPAVLVFIGFVVVPAISAYLDLGQRLLKLIQRLKRKGEVVRLPRLTLQVFVALAVEDAIRERSADLDSLQLEVTTDFPTLRELRGKKVDYGEHIFLVVLSDKDRIYQYFGCASPPYIRLVTTLRRSAALQMGWQEKLVQDVSRIEPGMPALPSQENQAD